MAFFQLECWLIALQKSTLPFSTRLVDTRNRDVVLTQGGVLFVPAMSITFQETTFS